MSSPVEAELEKREAPRPRPVAGVVEVAGATPRFKEKPAGPVWGAEEVRTVPRLSPVAAGAEVVVVSEKGAAEADGFPNPKPNPAEAAVDAGVPENTTTAY